MPYKMDFYSVHIVPNAKYRNQEKKSILLIINEYNFFLRAKCIPNISFLFISCLYTFS